VILKGSLRSLGKSHPEDKDELEGVVEGYQMSVGRAPQSLCLHTEPVDGIDGALEDGEERKGHPVLRDRVSCVFHVWC
jgi:hypothetical protein